MAGQYSEEGGWQKKTTKMSVAIFLSDNLKGPPISNSIPTQRTLWDHYTRGEHSLFNITRGEHSKVMLQPLQVSTVCHSYCLKALTFDKPSVFSYHVCMLYVTTNSKTTFPRKSHVYWKSIHFHRITLIENIAIWENLCAGEMGVN